MKKVNRITQRHAGKTKDGKDIWHEEKKGYWSGFMWSEPVAPEELLLMCESTIFDLIEQHPELRRR